MRHSYQISGLKGMATKSTVAYLFTEIAGFGFIPQGPLDGGAKKTVIMKKTQQILSSLLYAVQLAFKDGIVLFFIPSFIFAFIFYLLVVSGTWLSTSLDFMQDWFIIGPLINGAKVLFQSTSFFLFEFFILIILSPINGILAEKARKNLTGIQTSFTLLFLAKTLKRMVIIITAALVIQFFITMTLWVFSFVLGDRFFEIASLINLSFFIGFSFFDYTLGLDLKSFKQSVRFAKKNALQLLWIGLIFNLFIYVPYKNEWFGVYLTAIAFIPHLLVMASARLYYKNA